jgi:formate dehydrogenase major subunit
MWGSNARAAHPIFFHHVLKGIRNGAKMYGVDPRRSDTAKWADAWLGIHVGSDISLANAIANEIIQAGLVDEEFIKRATVNFEAYKESVANYPLERAERDSGVPKELIRQLAHDYAKADRAQICWTLGITEHHNATDNVLALINLSLLTGHVGKYGSGLVPLRGQNNVQGGGDMGAIPNKLAGFQDIQTNHDARERFGAKYGVPIPDKNGLHLSQMFDAMNRGELTCAYVIGENPVSSEADTHHTRKMLEGLECLVV